MSADKSGLADLRTGYYALIRPGALLFANLHATGASSLGLSDVRDNVSMSMSMSVNVKVNVSEERACLHILAEASLTLLRRPCSA